MRKSRNIYLDTRDDNMNSLLNKLVLGTVQFGCQYGINSAGRPSDEEIKKILGICKSTGIDTLDTSAAYGNSEDILGNVLDADEYFKIISKYPICSLSVQKRLSDTLNALHIGKLYGYLLHHFGIYVNNPDIWNDFVEMKQMGKTEKIGFSIYTTDELDRILDDNVPFDIVQIPYNIFDRKFEPYLEELHNRGILIHVRSVFLQGLFFKNTQNLRVSLKPLKTQLDKLHDYCNLRNISIEEIALNYILSNPNVSGVLIGVDNSEQLKSNIRIANRCLTQNDIDFIKSIEIEDKQLLNPSNW